MDNHTNKINQSIGLKSRSVKHPRPQEAISIFDIFKIGVGPSSSHTLGPWKAARGFMSELELKTVDHIQVHLYGSLSKTGKGHATDKAIIMGLLGHDPEAVDASAINGCIEAVIEQKTIDCEKKCIQFNPRADIIFEKSEHDLHPNTMRFRAFNKGEEVKEEFILSVGGGFIEKAQGAETDKPKRSIPYPVNTGAELLDHTNRLDCSISDLSLKNELSWRSLEQIESDVQKLYSVNKDAIYRGCTMSGVLPGGLKVARRAKMISSQLLGTDEVLEKEVWYAKVQQAARSYDDINKWVSCFALAVNEENAAMSRVVTSPTNGAAGVIPAVLHFHLLFQTNTKESDILRFFLVAGEIGCLFKKGATISAAVGGCQAEIGVSSAMAAAGLCEVLGGSPAQVLMAAEIAMEHHLGLTCDPIGGLVQIPCIERNAMGAAKAITAANLALMSDVAYAKVHIDDVISTMWSTAQDMHHKYKETSEGGLAFHLPVVQPNC